MNILNGKRIIITGGAGGIGHAALRLCHEYGATVACTFNSEQPVLPPGVASERCDITKKVEVDEVFDRLVRRLGGLDVLVHAAGAHGSCPADQIEEKDWDRLFTLNVKATLFVNQAAFRHMRDQGGSIVNMGSCEGVRGFAGNGCYAASRGAVMAWTRSVALEWGCHNIRVNALAPVAETRIALDMRSHLDEEAQAAMDAHLARAIPLGGKLGDPYRDIAPVIAFLASDASHFVTGQTLSVDGGLMMLGS